jgi:sigma-B regulation protein RsbU (phosphoserine phosphatase)
MSTHGYESTPEAERRLIELHDLLEISQTLNQSLDLDAILNQLLLTSMGRFAAGRGLFLLDAGVGEPPVGDEALARFRVAVCKGIADMPVGTEIEIPCAPDATVDLASNPEGFHVFTQRKLALLVPLRRAGVCVGILALGRKLTGSPYLPLEIEFLESLASVSTPAIQNSRVYEEVQALNTRLDRKIHELNTLFEISRNLVATFDAEEVIRLFSYALMGQLLISKHLLVLRRPAGYVVRGRGIKYDDPCPWTSDLFWEALSSIPGPIRVDATTSDLATHGVSALVPIRKENVTHGFLGLGGKPGGHSFTDDELAFAGALANQAIISLENAWLFDETVEKRRLEEEMALASLIQRKLFPKSLPAIPGYELDARSTPTRHVGGDYYDMIDLGDGRTLIAIADVSGKGAPASLLMSSVQASLRALAHPDIDLAAAALRINELIYENTDFNKYATFFYGVLDSREHRFSYTNAGHNPPFLLRANGEMETLTVGGLPIGLMPGMGYEQAEVDVGPGDLLVLYTDGVSEAMDADDQEFGEARVEELIREGGSAAEVLERVASAVAVFSEGLPQADDITMVVLRRVAGSR